MSYPVEESNRLAVERQRRILAILEREGVVRNTELAELLGVSTVTVRSDLRELAANGECEIIWGGAISLKPTRETEFHLERRSRLNPEAKQRIGERAARLVEDGQTIIVDAGTTTIEAVRALPHDFEYLRIVTPALNVATAAAYYPNYELVMTGGILRSLTWGLIGPQVLRALEMFNAHWTFLASGGFDLEHGVTTSHILEVEVKRTMVARAKRVALLADSSKFGKTLSLSVAPLHALHVLVTDTGLSEEHAAAIQALGVEVLRV
ncbi:MAG: DeoR/GlpR family DNA-binding transcription regulator [Anaerolineae bacterium]|nr:DeoR/GlpR family DNA-binding transcription regulator [Anaerolineae bacterium]MDW8172148.1 DeoR/GlpR family DNA-binding transcription regulator [Anaerolineae bacterium]